MRVAARHDIQNARLRQLAIEAGAAVRTDMHEVRNVARQRFAPARSYEYPKGSDVGALTQQSIDECGGLCGRLSPHQLIARTDDVGEIERTKRHGIQNGPLIRFMPESVDVPTGSCRRYS